MQKKVIVRYFVREAMGLVVMGVALFWAAGRMDWWQAWALLAVMAAWIIATAVVILRTNPGLLAERLGPRRGAKRWDTVIMSLLGLFQLARYIIAGLDHRHGWIGDSSLPLQFLALGIAALGYALVVWATAENAWFSQIVRLQPERGQTVVSSGPYRFVRHPAYLGAILYEPVSCIILASWWAAIPAAICVLLLILRTFLEDRTLQAELPGYAEYARKVRFRLLPGLW